MACNFSINNKVLLGIAYNEYIFDFIAKNKALIDFVEIPFEVLLRDDSIIKRLKEIQIILHSASLSMVSKKKQSKDLVTKLDSLNNLTNSPWIGEHITFIEAESISSINDQINNIGFTVSPAYTRETLNNTIDSIEYYSKYLSAPLILENPPVYFSMCIDTFTQVEFINELCSRTKTKLILDISHFIIMCKNLKLDPWVEIKKYPLQNVVEYHLSGISEASGIFWDDHAQPASEETWNLLEYSLNNSSPKAITLEYNWSTNFPMINLQNDLKRARKLTQQESINVI